MKRTLIILLITLLLPMSVAAQEAYVVYSDFTLTFYYDNNRNSRTGIKYGLNEVDEAGMPIWLNHKSTFDIVEFDPSFANARPETTEFWFSGCVFLHWVKGIENLNTSEVTKMNDMFKGCESLTSLVLDSFDTSKVTDMSGMFEDCNNLTTLVLNGFDTSKVTDMSCMFEDCNNLAIVDLSDFDTHKVTDMTSMFEYCNKLTTIYADGGWNTDKVKKAKYMFNCCTSILGGEGTTYDINHVDASYARIDGAPNKPGYFTFKEKGVQPYAVYNDNALLFYYDKEMSSRTGDVYSIYGTGWVSDHSTDIKVVMFTPSFADARPTSTSRWFYNCTNLTTVQRLKNLNTSYVTDMTAMFYNCQNLIKLDVGGFDTRNVEDMTGLFYRCYRLEGLDVSGWYTKRDVLKKVDGMFYGCESLTTIDLSNWETRDVTNMSAMFFNCKNLTTIYCGNGWTTQSVNNSEDMFKNCIKLVGGMGTTYNENFTDKTYAREDEGTSRPGYLTKKKIILGDVNGDGNVNSADVQKVYQLMAQGATGINHPEADVNKDGNVNSADIQKIYGIMASK